MVSKLSRTPALAVAHEIAGVKDDIITLSTGYRAKIKPVSVTLIDAAVSRIVDPEPPVYMNEDKGREEPNPLDPAYRRTLEENAHKRSMASVDVMILMGVTLLDPIPPDIEWLVGLKQLQRLGHLDLTFYDLEDALDREFLFKRFVAVGNDDLKLITARMGISEADMKAAEVAFPGNTA